MSHPLSVPLHCSVRPVKTGAVLGPCMSSQPRTSTGAWLTWTSTGGYLPACLVVVGDRGKVSGPDLT